MQPLTKWMSRNRGYIRQVLLSIAVSILALLYGLLATWPSLAIEELLDGVAGFSVTQEEISVIVSMATLGMFMMPILFGFILVRLGRKTNLLLSAVMYIIAWVLIILARSHLWLIAGNLFGGFGSGTLLVIGPMYIAEIAEKRIRGALIGFYVTFYAVGEIFLTTVGMFISYFTMNAIALAVSIIALLCVLIFATESPSWHFICNEDEKAEKSFKHYWNMNTNTEESQASRTAALAQLKETVDAEMKSKCSYLELFRTPSNVRASTIIIVLSLLQASSGIMAILTYGSTTLPKYDGFWQPNPTMALFNVLDLVFNIVGLGLIDRWGRKPLTIISNAGGALGTGIIAIYFLIDEYTSVDTTNIKWLPYIGSIVFISFYGFAMAAMPHVLVSELFPANVRYHGSVVSACCISGCFAFLNFIYLYVCRFVGVSAMFLIFTLSNIVATAFSCYYIFETKNLSLAEIQEKSIRRNKSRQTK